MERGILNGGVIAGVLCMVGAVVWFVLGLQAGVIFFYPPVLFIVGLTAAVRGIISTVD